jgi:hypothetical protein
MRLIKALDPWYKSLRLITWKLRLKETHSTTERRSQEPAALGPLWMRWHPRKRITQYIGTGELISLD